MISPQGATLPIGEAAADAAAEWLMRMMSGEFGDDECQQWQRWRTSDPDHERAWQHIEAVSARLQGLRGTAAYRSLSPLADLQAPGRRRALVALLWLGAGAGTGVLASRTQAWQKIAADHRTAIGEQRSLTLQDGTRLLLDSGSAVDVRFDASQRRLRLVAGAVMVTTGHGVDGHADLRPLLVETAEGSVRALGTRFTVRQEAGRSHVAVLESAVEIRAASLRGQARLLQAGQSLSFTRSDFGAPVVADETGGAWTRGQLIADDMRLDDFLAELGRYRPGVLRCDPAVAGLRFSGVFPLQDPDRVLALLPNSLPVRVRHAGRWWVVIEPAP